MSPTPEFIRWAIARRCLLRDSPNWEQPERAERQLQALRSYGEAVEAGRFCEGICVEATVAGVVPRLGFRATELLDAYGGEAFVNSQCVDCSANVVRGSATKSLAGCFGMFEFSAFGSDLHRIIDEAILETTRSADFDTHFLPTKPRWYGLWVGAHPADLSPTREGEAPAQPHDSARQEPRPPAPSADIKYATRFSATQLELHLRLTERLIARDPRFATALDPWLVTLRTVQNTNTPLLAALYPPGEISEQRWIVSPHCPRCHAVRLPAQRVCAVCRSTSHALPSRRRHVRGSRPYWPLRSFMNENAVAEFLEHYAQRPSPGASSDHVS